MSLNFRKSCSFMPVQTCLLHDEKPRTVKQRFPRQSGVHFVFTFRAKTKSVSFALSKAGPVGGFSFIHALLRLHRWQRSTPDVSVLHSQ